ncbi:Transglutaminase elicitor [Phytophthora cactorum]|nr:Transglutaminase elicitor [Phytophthora cactorum]
MVYTPRAYLVSAAVALVVTSMQQTAASSLYYDPLTTSGTDGKISGKFPARGAEVADQDCTFTVEVDPTLPDITTISTVPVTYPDLLASTTTAPADPVSTKVGKAIVSKETPTQDADQDAYIGKSTTVASTPITAPTVKTGTTTPVGKTGTTTGTAPPSKTSTTTPSAGVVQGTPGNAKPKDCATGWEETKPTRKLRDSAVSGRELDEKLQTKRQLEANTNKDIAKLEAYFGTSMETTLKNLPTEGVHTPSPWPGPYWPTYQDGINVQWSQGEASPAENGCGIRAGQSSGYCIPTWYGICHAWTPASMLEAEPNCPVTHNGVTFHPMDLKALISDIYDGASISTLFTGTRFNGGSNTPDEYGRHSSAAYRDLNPAFFHITAANLLGKLNATFIADVTAGSEVWNQPVRGFKVYEQTEMSLEEAAQTFYGLETYPWNAAAKSIVYVKSRLSWIFETYTDGGLVSSGQVDQFTTGAYYTYLLEMDDDGTIIGGEWVYKSDDDHPDFIWFPKAKPAADTVTSIGLSYADVSMLLENWFIVNFDIGLDLRIYRCFGFGLGNELCFDPTGSSTDVPATSSTASNAGSNTATPTGTPAATYASTGSSAVTTAPASSNQGGNQGDGNHHGSRQNQGGNRHQGVDSDHQQQQQEEEGRGQRQSHQSFFHWW